MGQLCLTSLAHPNGLLQRHSSCPTAPGFPQRLPTTLWEHPRVFGTLPGQTHPPADSAKPLGCSCWAHPGSSRRALGQKQCLCLRPLVLGWATWSGDSGLDTADQSCPTLQLTPTDTRWASPCSKLAMGHGAEGGRDWVGEGGPSSMSAGQRHSTLHPSQSGAGLPQA